MPRFVDEGSLFTLKIGKKSIGCLFEKVEDRIHFGIYTMENVRGKGLHIVEKYLNLYKKDYILHTTEKCDIADFYKLKYGFIDLLVIDKSDLQLILQKG